jgi:hypothetical protein
MSVTYSYTGTYDLGQLHDEMVVAGITVETIRGTTSAIDVVCADGTLEASVDAVEAAHVAGPPQPRHVMVRVQAGDATGIDSTNAQPWFTLRGGAYVYNGSNYHFEGLLWTTLGLGVPSVSHTTSILFGGTATVSEIHYQATCNTGDTAASEAANVLLGSAATALVVKAASTSATEVVRVKVSGIFRCGGSGTFTPQFKYSAAPGGVPTIKSMTYFKVERIGSSTYYDQGAWA